MPVYTFLDGINTDGLMVYPVCTHEGNGLGMTDRCLSGVYPKARIMPGIAIRGTSVQENRADAVAKLRDYLENGNITNSVNYPNCEMGRQANTTRIVLLHHNVPNMIGQFTRILARDNMNIADLSNKSKGEYAYTMIDIDNDVPESVAEDLRKVGEVLRVRIIH